MALSNLKALHIETERAELRLSAVAYEKISEHLEIDLSNLRTLRIVTQPNDDRIIAPRKEYGTLLL